MTRDEAELLVNDVKLIAEGIERFFKRINANPDLNGRPLPEVILAMQETGALSDMGAVVERLAEHLPADFMIRLTNTSGAAEPALKN